MTARKMTSTALVSLCVGVCWLAFSISAASGENGAQARNDDHGVFARGESFGAPWGIAFDGGGQLLVGDSVHSAIDIFESSNLFAPPQLVSSALAGDRYLRHAQRCGRVAGTGDPVMSAAAEDGNR